MAISPAKPIDPELFKSGVKPLLEGGTQSAVDSALVDQLLSKELTPGANTSIPFEYEMARTDRPDRDFLKRVSGQLRSMNGRYEVSLQVSDIDGNWLTTDQCVVLNVTFQATIAVTAGGVVSRGFSSFTVPVTAPDGKADIRVPLSLEQRGDIVDLRVTGVAAKACGRPTPAAPVPQCPTSLDDQLELVRLRGALNHQAGLLQLTWTEFHQELLSVRGMIRDLQKDTDRIALETRVSSLITILEQIAGRGLNGIAIVGPKLIDIPASSALRVLLRDVEEGEAIKDALIDVLKTAAGASREVLEKLLFVSKLVQNELELAKAKATAAEVIDSLDRVVDAHMQRMSVIEARLGATKVELARLDALCN